MTDGKPFLLWLKADDRTGVDVMIRNPGSIHWEECSQFVKWSVHAKAKNIPRDRHDEIAQEVMYKVVRSLPDFRFQCSLKTWLNIIIERCIIDSHRRLQNEEQLHVPLTDQSNEGDHEGESFTSSEEKSAEDTFMINDEIRKGWEALLEYAKIHSNSIRDQHIIQMIVREGKTHTETAIAVGCSAPVVGYVVREAQRYAREKMEHRYQD